jgi:hypothetical protein
MKLESLPDRFVDVSVSACLASSARGAVESEPKPRDSNTGAALGGEVDADSEAARD